MSNTNSGHYSMINTWRTRDNHMKSLVKITLPPIEEFFTEDFQRSTLDRLRDPAYRMGLIRTEWEPYNDVVLTKFHNFLGVSWTYVSVNILPIDGATAIHMDTYRSMTYNLYDDAVMDFWQYSSVARQPDRPYLSISGKPGTDLEKKQHKPFTFYLPLTEPDESYTLTPGMTYLTETTLPHLGRYPAGGKGETHSRVCLAIRSDELKARNYTWEQTLDFFSSILAE
jgi:hypothetical protein